jgi:ribonuclease VapC
LPSIPTSVLDASALLAQLKREPGSDVVELAVGRGAAINLVNWSEVLTYVARTGGSIAEVIQAFSDRGLLGREGLLILVPIAEADARLAAELVSRTSRFGLSLADRLCIAIGLRLHLPILTADRLWAELDVPGADVRLIRPA